MNETAQAILGSILGLAFTVLAGTLLYFVCLSWPF